MTGWATTVAMLKAPRPGAMLEAFRRSDAFVRALMGPVNAGRSTTCILQIVDEAWQARTRSRWAVVRASLDQLTAKTLPAWFERVPAEMGAWDGRARRHVFPFVMRGAAVAELEVVFLAADQAADRRRIGALELTGAWIHQAREVGERGVLDDLVDAVGQHPPLLELARSGAAAPRAGVLLSSRPPAEGHWWRALFEVEQPAGYALFRQPSGRAPEAENRANLPPGFYDRAAAKPADWVRVNVDGEYPESAPIDAAAAAARRRLWTFYPDEGPLRRELYPKHLQFFAAGAAHRERMALAANRVGKTEGMGGYEAALHLTGHYPDWWTGRRFTRPVRGWAAGKTTETTRDIIQAKLFGAVAWRGSTKTVAGTGLVPGDAVGDVSWRRGSDLIDTIKIEHRTAGAVDGWSVLGLKSYEQGRGSFEGTEQDFIWLDEEPDLEIYTECLVRTMTTSGLVMLTFTPLEGMSEVVMSFLPGGQLPGATQEAA